MTNAEKLKEIFELDLKDIKPLIYGPRESEVIKWMDSEYKDPAEVEE